MVEISKEGNMSFSVESDGDHVDIDIDDGTVNLRLSNEGAEEFAEHLLEEAGKSE
ncbi:hypothetical protein [Halorubrum sp. Atlit-26R]|uniref:hypothetical protein n=1 Tax=Halorubrum sp. Atlit-26R TaxID=2282128 RepID=UPI0013142F15|nr:hypothetical protein [Halorubrum sp. Atlit-26R]